MVTTFKQFLESAGKFVFYMSCDRFRLGKQNEQRWLEMMSNKLPVTMEEFLDDVDPSGLLDPGETFQQYYENAKASDPETGLYWSSIGGTPVYFVQTAGFEMIFTQEGFK